MSCGMLQKISEYFDRHERTIILCLALLYAFGIFFGRAFGELFGLLIILCLLVFPRLRARIHWRDPFVFFFLLCALWIIISTLWNRLSIREMTLALTWPRFLLLFLVLNYGLGTNTKTTRYAYMGIFGITVFIIFDALVQFGLGRDLLGKLPLSPTRISGPMISYNLGMYLTLFTPLSLIYLVSYQRFAKLWQERLAVYTFLILASFVVFLSGERMFFLFMMIMLVLFSFWYVRKTAFYMVIIASFSLVLLLNLGPAYKERLVGKSQAEIVEIIHDLRTDEFETGGAHGGYGTHMRRGVLAFLDSPFLGHGIHSLKSYCRKAVIVPDGVNRKKLGCTSHVHNHWISWAMYFGLPGLLLWCLFLGALLRANWLLFCKPGPELQLRALASFWVLLPFIQPAFTANSFFNNNTELVFWFALSFAWLGAYPQGMRKQV